MASRFKRLTFYSRTKFLSEGGAPRGLISNTREADCRLQSAKTCNTELHVKPFLPDTEVLKHLSTYSLTTLGEINELYKTTRTRVAFDSVAYFWLSYFKKILRSESRVLILYGTSRRASEDPCCPF